MAAPVNSDEILSRFIFHSDCFRTSDNTVKHTAFLPGRDGETSVFRISGISQNEICDIGHEVGAKRGKPMLGWAAIIAYIILNKGLKIIPSEPPTRHAIIVGWPQERSGQRLIALELAANAELHLVQPAL